MFLCLGQSNEGRNKEVEVWKERPGISADLRPENIVKSETMDMFPLTNTGVPPHCQTLYLLFNNDLATTIWTFHRLLLADIDIFLGR